jgi:DNA-binding CsgD family transcriptional regulator
MSVPSPRSLDEPPQLAVDKPPTSLRTDSPDLFDHLRDRLTERQREVYWFKFIGEKKNSTIAAILRVSLSTIEKELKAIRRIRSEICAASIEEALVREVRIPVARGHNLALGSNKTLRAVITGLDRRRISLRS